MGLRASGAAMVTGRLGLFFLALGGTIFSAYLTFLEPFVIGATCGWCLVSAVMMATIRVPRADAEPGRDVSASSRVG